MAGAQWLYERGTYHSLPSPCLLENQKKKKACHVVQGHTEHIHDIQILNPAALISSSI